MLGENAARTPLRRNIDHDEVAQGRPLPLLVDGLRHHRRDAPRRRRPEHHGRGVDGVGRSARSSQEAAARGVVARVRVVLPLLAERARRAVAREEAHLVAEREEPLADGAEQRRGVAARAGRCGPPIPAKRVSPVKSTPSAGKWSATPPGLWPGVWSTRASCSPTRITSPSARKPATSGRARRAEARAPPPGRAARARKGSSPRVDVEGRAGRGERPRRPKTWSTWPWVATMRPIAEVGLGEAEHPRWSRRPDR